MPNRIERLRQRFLPAVGKRNARALAAQPGAAQKTLDPEIGQPRRGQRSADETGDACTQRCEPAIEGEQRGLPGPFLTVAREDVQEIVNAPVAFDEPLSIRAGKNLLEPRRQLTRL